MFSLRTAVLVAATAFSAVVGGDYVIDPSSVPESTRDSWCQSQTQTCPYICRDMGSTGAQVNTCNATTLEYGCLCNDGTTPNSSEYSLTLPYFTCVEWVSQCVADCGSNSDCSGACQQDHPCGATNPTLSNVTASTTASSSDATSTDGSTVYGGLSGGSSAAGPPAFELARLYATLASLGLFGMGFMYLL